MSGKENKAKKSAKAESTDKGIKGIMPAKAIKTDKIIETVKPGKTVKGAKTVKEEAKSFGIAGNMVPVESMGAHAHRFSFAEYSQWPANERWELIDGQAFDMSPTPNQEHQEISTNLSGVFWQFLKGKPCKVFHAPFDVRLPTKKGARDQEIVNVVQPDLLVVCDPAKLDGKGVIGAPDLVMEIISPQTISHDHVRKLNLYAVHGVREYWIVSPEERCLTVLKLAEKGRFGEPQMYFAADIITVGIFPDLKIDLSDIFPFRQKAPHPYDRI